jgi:uncharacterized membrane protein HdeD (DUF308 family)
VSLAALARNWWMMAIRGALAIGFGLTVLILWPGVTLSTIVLLFGAYALLDGAWTIAAGTRAAAWSLDAWPVVLEGVVSVGLGVLALAWPFVPRQFVYVLAGWGLATGALEILGALRVPREGAGYWLLLTAGFSSLFLALLILLILHADTDLVVRGIAAYAQVFGVVMLLAAIWFPRGTSIRG